MKKNSDQWLFAMQSKDKRAATDWRSRLTAVSSGAIYFQDKAVLCQKLIELCANLLNQYFLRILARNTRQTNNNNHFTRNPVKQAVWNPHNLCRTTRHARKIPLSNVVIAY